MMNNKFVFFGTDDFALEFLKTLKEKGLEPSFIICGEDKAQKRGLKVLPPPVKIWAIDNNIDFLQPENLDGNLIQKLKNLKADFFLVASYGKIMPKELIDVPKFKTLNLHPSLLPRLRGASPIQNLILQEETPGITIMKMDEKMDHGPILSQRELKTEVWPIKYSELSPMLAKLGGELFAEILPNYLEGKIEGSEQNHNEATFTKKVKKDDSLLDLDGNPWENYKKILAYNVWPRAYFFAQKNDKQIRVIVTEASFENQELKIEKVIPEGKKEIDYKNFLQSLKLY